MQSSKFYSSCGSRRFLDEFSVNKNRELFKTCFRHKKKRKQPSFDSWEDFLSEIRDWNRPPQTNKINTNYVFQMDELPVAFGLQPKIMEDGTFDKSEINEAMGNLSDLIWHNGDFRFRKRSSTAHSLTYYFKCAQDIDFFSKTLSRGERDTKQMDRFPCGSKLPIKPSFDVRTLTLSLIHDYHSPYIDIHLSSEIQTFVETHRRFQSPSEIHQNIQDMRVSGFNLVAQSQIYYLWHKLSVKEWKRHENQLEPAKLLVDEKREDYFQLEFSVDNYRGLGLYINGAISNLAQKTKELAIDATYGTNNAGCDLYAVLAEFDRTGIPLAYLFVQKTQISENIASVVPGKITLILSKFFKPLLNLGFNPSFFACLKDKSEINAIQQIWPTARAQLYFWHAKRAIQNKLKDSNRADSLVNYLPDQAQKLIPELEICWGSYPKNRIDLEHRSGNCKCESTKLTFDGNGSLGILSLDDRKKVVAIFSRHFNVHSVIPDINGLFRSPEKIHRDCANEMYTWCKSRNYFRLWAYLYSNWYKNEQWALWALSNCAQEIPVLRTTMIVESHWRRIKHDFLHRFNRPRVDMVVWVLLSRSIPQGLSKMKAIQDCNHRMGVASWRKKFKQQWKKFTSLGVDEESLQKYHTNAASWTCGCEAFLLSRFLICKHIVYCYKDLEDPNNFFLTVCRQCSSPFWSQPQLNLRPEFEPITDGLEGSDEQSDQDSISDLKFEKELNESWDDDQLVEMDEEPSSPCDVPKFVSKMNRLLDHLIEQYSIGDLNFAERVIRQNAGNMILVEEIEQRKNSHIRARTWGNYKKPATMYYQ